MCSYILDIFGGSFLGNMVCLPGKKEKVFMEACCFAAIVNVIMNFILIPIGGAGAAAFTSGISTLVILIWLLAKKDKRVKLDYLWEVCKAPLVGSLLIVLFCLIIKYIFNNVFITIVLCVGGSVLVYGAAMILLKNQLIIEIVQLLKNKLINKHEVH